MSSMPRPGSWASATWVCQYDAWNRLAQVLDLSMGINTVERYEYDGLNRRVVKNVFDGGSLDHRLHFYYNESWQVLEVRREESSVESEDPVEQFVWHPYYIDALATRFWDEDADGMSVEQHYFTHDANFNVTAALDDSGDVVERYHYSPYGEVTFLDDAFDPLAESAIDNWHLFTGRERDSETGLQLNRNRYYHPTLGRWVSRDPISYRGSKWNLHEYVKSSPISLYDSSGLQAPTESSSEGDLSTEVATFIDQVARQIASGAMCGNVSFSVNADVQNVAASPNASRICRGAARLANTQVGLDLLRIYISRTYNFSLPLIVSGGTSWDLCPLIGRTCCLNAPATFHRQDSITASITYQRCPLEITVGMSFSLSVATGACN